jgi:hypothetical protein
LISTGQPLNSFRLSMSQPPTHFASLIRLSPRHWLPPAAAAAADTPLRQPLLIFASARHASHDADGARR